MPAEYETEHDLRRLDDEIRWTRVEVAWRKWVEAREATKAAYQEYRAVRDRELSEADAAAFVASRSSELRAPGGQPEEGDEG
jgi:hypothetical protein